MNINALITLLQKHADTGCDVFMEQDNGYGPADYPIKGIRVEFDVEGQAVSVVLL